MAENLKVVVREAVVREIQDYNYKPTIPRQINLLKSMIAKLNTTTDRELYIAAVSVLHDLEDENDG